MSSNLNDAQIRAYESLTPMEQKACMALLSGASHADAYEATGGEQEGKGREVYISRMLKKERVANFMRLMEYEVLAEYILSKERALELLSNIAETSDSERNSIAAIKELADIQGWRAPTRSQIEIPGGVSHRYSPEDYEKAAGAIRGHFGG